MKKFRLKASSSEERSQFWGIQVGEGTGKHIHNYAEKK